MTIDRVQADEAVVISLPRRDRGTALAVLALSDQLDSERAAHGRARDELGDLRRQLRQSRELVGDLAGRVLPRVGEPCPALTGPLVRPFIYDALGAEFLTFGTVRHG